MVVLMGLGVILLCTIFQCALVAGYIHVILAMKEQGKLRLDPLHFAVALSATVLVLLCGNLVQTAIWAGVFRLYGEFQHFERAFYFSLVNFTTLGYGDIVLKDERAVLGPLEAINGVVMLGLTTSVLFAVLANMFRDSMNRSKNHPTER